MPPKLALYLCYIIIFVLFIRHLKEYKGKVSNAIWIPTFWMMYCASRSLCYWITPASLSAYEVPSCIYDTIMLSFLMVLGFYVLSTRFFNINDFVSRNKFLIILYGYMLISCIWSYYPFISFKRWMKTVGDLIMVLVVLTEFDVVQAIAAMFRRCFYLLIPLSVVFIKYFPAIGRHTSKHWGPDMWVGVTTHKNPLGQLAMLSALYFLWNIFVNKDRKNLWIDIGYIAMTVYLLNGGGHCRSATSIIALLFAIVFYSFLRYARPSSSKIWTYITYIALSVITIHILSFAIFGQSINAVLADLAGKDPTLAGRTDLWKDLINLGLEHPILGYGFRSFWIAPVHQWLIEKYTWSPGQAHNGYIETFINLGIIGLFLLLLYLVKSLIVAVKLAGRDDEFGRIKLVLMLAIIMINYTEATFLRPCHLIWFIFLLVSVDLYHYNPIKEPVKDV